MNRRDAILLALLGIAMPAAFGQQAKVARVGVLRPGSSKEPAAVQREPFERGLRELGWQPGVNIVLHYRYAEGDSARLAPLATELVVKERVDVLVATAVAIQGVRQAQPNVPLVMAASVDPVAEGLAESLARPGRNATGIAIQTFDMDGKRLEILREAFPQVRRVAMLANPTNELGYQRRIDELRAGAKRLKIDLEILAVTNGDQVAAALSAIERGGFDAMMVRAEARVMDVHRQKIVEAAARMKVPAMYSFRFYVEAGGLMSYGESVPAFHYRSASFVSRILRGARAGELAFERSTTYELVINQRAANALGTGIPQTVLFRADEVIK